MNLDPIPSYVMPNRHADYRRIRACVRHAHPGWAGHEIDDECARQLDGLLAEETRRRQQVEADGELFRSS